MDLQGKRAIITGASRGIGLAVAESLASEGIKVFMTARNGGDLQRAVEGILSRGGMAHSAPADLGDPQEIESAFASALKFLGGVDILINNAGINFKKPVAELSVKEWDQILNINLRAAFILSKLAAAKMMEQKSGYIINIGSGAAQTPIAEYTAYCASKYGLLGFSESLALELRSQGIKVSIILPGSTATHFGGSSPKNKLSSLPGMLAPGDIADCVLFLLRQSPQAWTSVMNLRPLNPKKS